MSQVFKNNIYIYKSNCTEYTTETRLPLFKNTDLEIVINLNIDKRKLRFQKEILAILLHNEYFLKAQ